MGAAVAALESAGVQTNVRLWQAGQPQPTKGLQRTLTREICGQVKDGILAQTTRRHAVAIRSSATSEAARFMDAPTEPQESMTDSHLRTAYRRRLALKPTPPCRQCSGTCRNVSAKGVVCGEALDEEGQHATTCEFGGALVRRHDAACVRLGKRVAADLGANVHFEQHIVELDRRNAEGKTTEARLDVIVSYGGRRWLLDLAIVSAYSNAVDEALELAASRRDGAAAQRAEDGKRRRYPGTEVVPIIFEAHGRLGETGLAWLHRMYKDEPAALQSLLKEMSVLVQSHTSGMALAAAAAS